MDVDTAAEHKDPVRTVLGPAFERAQDVDKDGDHGMTAGDEGGGSSAASPTDTEVKCTQQDASPDDCTDRKVVLVSLFDGVGTALVALLELLTQDRLQHRLHEAVFVESEDCLAQAVQKAWATKHADGRGPAYRRLARSVWDLLRDGARPFREFLESLPTNVLLILTADPPRQPVWQKGVADPCGPESSHLLAVPLLAHAAETCRPDIVTQVVLQTSTGATPELRNVIADLLRIPSQAHSPTIDAQPWTAFAKAGVFHSVMPPGRGVPRRPSRPGIWDAGWKPRSPVLPAMVRSYGEHAGRPIPPTYQFAPKFLLYSDYWAPDRTVKQIAQEIRGMMPEDAQQAWDILVNCLTHDSYDEATLPAIRWLLDHEDAARVRIPNTRERGKALGMWQYLKELGMEERRLFDAQGEITDKEALTRRIAYATVGWLRGSISLDNAATAGPREVSNAWDQLVRGAASGMTPPMGGPLDLIDLASLEAATDRVLEPRNKCHKRSHEQEREGARVEHQYWDGIARDSAAQGDARVEHRVIDLGENEHGLGRPVRGHSGAGGQEGLVNVCVVDSIMQLLYGTAQAGSCGRAAARVRNEAARIRTTLELGPCKHNHDRNPDGLISAAEAWLIIAAREFQGARPGPILIEIPCMAEDRNRVNAAERRAYSTHGPWDGQIMVVVTGGGHTEPVWWEKDGVRLAKVPVDRQALPPVVTISGDLGVAGLFAMYYRLSMRWWSRARDEAPGDMNQLVLATTVKVCWERDLGAIRLPESAIQTIDFRRQAAEGAFDHEAVAVVLLEGEYQQQTQDPNYAERPAERAIFGNHREGNTTLVILHKGEVAVAEAESHHALGQILEYIRGSVRSRGGA